ncbi:hypothetical protein RCL1_008135 [Eukaryota sp. TZLM3-RCL]
MSLVSMFSKKPLVVDSLFHDLLAYYSNSVPPTTPRDILHSLKKLVSVSTIIELLSLLRATSEAGSLYTSEEALHRIFLLLFELYENLILSQCNVLPAQSSKPQDISIVLSTFTHILKFKFPSDFACHCFVLMFACVKKSSPSFNLLSLDFQGLLIDSQDSVIQFSLRLVQLVINLVQNELQAFLNNLREIFINNTIINESDSNSRYLSCLEALLMVYFSENYENINVNNQIFDQIFKMAQLSPAKFWNLFEHVSTRFAIIVLRYSHLLPLEKPFFFTQSHFDFFRQHNSKLNRNLITLLLEHLMVDIDNVSWSMWLIASLNVQINQIVSTKSRDISESIKKVAHNFEDQRDFNHEMINFIYSWFFSLLIRDEQSVTYNYLDKLIAIIDPKFSHDEVIKYMVAISSFMGEKDKLLTLSLTLFDRITSTIKEKPDQKLYCLKLLVKFSEFLNRVIELKIDPERYDTIDLEGETKRTLFYQTQSFLIYYTTLLSSIINQLQGSKITIDCSVFDTLGFTLTLLFRHVQTLLCFLPSFSFTLGTFLVNLIPPSSSNLFFHDPFVRVYKSFDSFLKGRNEVKDHSYYYTALSKMRNNNRFPSGSPFLILVSTTLPNTSRITGLISSGVDLRRNIVPTSSARTTRVIESGPIATITHTTSVRQEAQVPRSRPLSTPFSIFSTLFSLSVQEISDDTGRTKITSKFTHKQDVTVAPAVFENESQYEDFFKPLIELECFLQLQRFLEDYSAEDQSVVVYDPTSNNNFSDHVVISLEFALDSGLNETELAFKGTLSSLSVNDVILFGNVADLSNLSSSSGVIGCVSEAKHGKYNVMVKKSTFSIKSRGYYGVISLGSFTPPLRQWEALRSRAFSPNLKSFLFSGKLVETPALPKSEYHLEAPLNSSQEAFLRKVEQTGSGILCLQGPPDLKILVCAPSNHAVDVIVESAAKFPCLQSKIKRVSAQSRDKHSPVVCDYLYYGGDGEGHLKSFPIVFTTLSSSDQHAFQSFVKYFDVLIIDEATQAVEPESIIPFKLLKDNARVILLGDHLQLSATVLSGTRGLEQSLFQRLVPVAKKNGRFDMLTIQYRMHQDILQFPNQVFYDNQLKNAYKQPKNHKIIFGSMRRYKPFMVITSSGLEEKVGLSFLNRGEADAVVAVLQDFQKSLVERLDELPQKIVNFSFSIMIICFYKRQKSYVERLVNSKPQYPNIRVEVVTADSAQGSEADLVILSPVRSSSSIGFLEDKRRLNVALTRARHFLFAVCNTAGLDSSRSEWTSLISFSRERSCNFDISDVVPAFIPPVRRQGSSAPTKRLRM